MAPAAAARGGQPALQHLDADPVPPARLRAPGRRPALHAAKGSDRPHGGAAGHVRLQPAERDAAVALRDGERAVRAARELRPAAARGQRRGAHGAAGGAAGGRRRSGSAKSCRSPSASAARSCATRWASGWRRTASPATSTSSAAPRKCRSPNTSRWPKPSRHEKSPSTDGLCSWNAANRLAGPLVLPRRGGATRSARSLGRAASGCGEPVSRVEGAAHAQRQRRHVDQFVGRHLFGGGIDLECRCRRARSVPCEASFARSAWLVCAERATEKNRST